MKKPVKNPAFRIAFCAVIAALSVVMMLITSLIPVGTFALPCIAGALLVAVVIEFGKGWALGVYGIVCLLSFFMAGDKEAVLFFALLFGYYPILKQVIESRIRSRILQYVIKFAVFNMAVIAAFWIASFILQVSAEEYTIFGIYMPYAFLAAGNLFFLLYDRALTVFVALYVQRIRGKLFGKFL